MAQNGKVIPNCVYASNPYHECSDYCLKKMSATPQKNKKSSDYRRNGTDGELGKKMSEEKRTHPACPKASNPYHECNEHCHKAISEGAIPLKFGKKNKGSKPEPPILDSVPATKIGAIYLSDAASPISHYSEKKKVEPKINEVISSKPVTLEKHLQDRSVLMDKPQPPKSEPEIIMAMPVNHKDQPKDSVKQVASPIRTKKEEGKRVSRERIPVTNADDTGEAITASAAGSMDFSFLGTSRFNEDSDEEDTGSIVSESRVPVGRYHVKESFAPILRSIFEKYGDIGASCHLESIVMRSYYIECVCFVVQELESDSIMQLTKSKIKELYAILKDVESAQIRAAWLRSILDEIAENIELINEHRVVEEEKCNTDREVESLQRELESEIETLAQKEKEIIDIKSRIAEIRDRMGELQLKSSELDKNMLSIKSKFDSLDSKSLLDELS